MLLRAARSPCWHVPRRLTRPDYTVPRSMPWPTTYHGTQLRLFSSLGSSWRKPETGDSAPERKTARLNSAPASELANADVVQKQKDTQNATSTKKNDLLSEATVANKEQRKADWAIMREMAKYLWPKVCLCS
jgi:ATP-binding cassette subfamily B (MDR/TAP) protein 7